MNDQKFQSFIDLVTFDQNLSELEKSIQIIHEDIKKMNDQLVSLSDQIELGSLKKRDLKKQLAAQELQMKSLQEREENQAKVVASISSTKELSAANKELEYLKNERNKNEQFYTQLINRVQTAERDSESVCITLQDEIDKINQILVQEQEKLIKAQLIIEETYKQRLEKLATVPDQWLDVYENMKGRVSDPVVKVNQDSCSACFYLISSKDLQLLKQNQLLQCKDCYRFLYY